MRDHHPHVTLEFADRDSTYHEVIPLRFRPGTVLNRVQKLLRDAEHPGFHRYHIVVEVTRTSLFLMFDVGDQNEAERFATLLAMQLGWRERDGVLVGRAG